MLSIAPIRRAGYFTDLAVSDYYSEGGERPGTWLAVAATECRVGGQVTQSSLENLLAGVSRSGQHALLKPHPRRQKGWDLTFSAPKSVSVLFAVASRKVRDQILKVHQGAIEAALRYLLQEAILARRGKGGSEFEHVQEVIAACFPHVTSRSVDPDLHTHVLLANLASRLDGKYSAIISREIYRHKMAAGAVYRTELAHLLQQELGVLIHRVRDWFEILGIPNALLRKFSSRSEEVRLIAREYGLSSPKFLELVTKVTQGVKGYLPHRELHHTWRNTAAVYGLTEQAAELLLGWPSSQLSEKRAERVAAKAAAKAIEHLTRRRSYFAEKDLVFHAARHVIGRGGGADLLRRSVETAKRQLIRLETPGLRYEQFTTPELYRLEKNVLDIVQRYGLSVGHQPVPFTRLLSALDRHASRTAKRETARERRERLNLEAAVRHLACSGEQVRFIAGSHRSGKTTALRLAKEVLEAAGKDVILCSATVAGTKELRREVGGQCVTVDHLLDLVNPTLRRRAAHAGKQLWRAARGKDTYRRGEKKLEVDQKIRHYFGNLRRVMRARLPAFAGKLKLGKNTVVLVDEGEKLDTRIAHQLLSVIKKGGSAVRIALAQDAPTGAGPAGALEHAAQKIGAFQLQREARPERETWRQLAHAALADGNPTEFLRQYRRTKSLTEAATLRRAISAVATDWVRNQLKPGEKLVIASDTDEVRRINKAIQRERAKRLQVALGGVKSPTGDVIRSGDRVRFERTNAALGVENGDFGRVLNVAVSRKNPLHKQITVVVDGKTRLGILPKVVVVRTKHYKHLSLGYAVLPHQAETKAKSVQVLLNADRNTRESLLHQVTRSKWKTRLYAVRVDRAKEVDLLLDALSQRQHLMTAHGLEESQTRKRERSLERERQLSFVRG